MRQLKSVSLFILTFLLVPGSLPADSPQWVSHQSTFSYTMPALELITHRRHEISHDLKYSATRFQDPPTIDGDLSDWAQISPISLSSKEQLCLLQKRFSGYIYPDQMLQLKKNWWQGPEDFSAQVYTCWDYNNFYIALDVVSKTPLYESSIFGILSRLWHKSLAGKQLSVLGFDVLGQSTYYREGIGLSDLNIEFRVNNGYPMVGISRECLGDFFEIDCPVELDRHNHDGGYRLEASIPWQFLEPLDPVLFNDVGLTLKVNSFKENRLRGFLSWGTFAPQGVHSDLVYGHLHFDTRTVLPAHPEIYIEMARYQYDDGEPLLIDVGWYSTTDVGDVAVSLSITDDRGCEEQSGTIVAENVSGGITRKRISWPVETLKQGDHTLTISINGGTLPTAFTTSRTIKRFSFDPALRDLESLENALRISLEKQRSLCEAEEDPYAKEKEAVAMFKLALKAAKPMISLPDRRQRTKSGMGKYNLYDFLQKLDILRRLESGNITDPKKPLVIARVKGHLAEITRLPAWQDWKERLLDALAEGPQEKISMDSPLCQVVAADQHVPVMWDGFASKPEFQATGLGIYLGPLCVGSCAVIELGSEVASQTFVSEYISESELSKWMGKSKNQFLPEIEYHSTMFKGHTAFEVWFDGHLNQLVVSAGTSAIRIIAFTPEITYRIAEWALDRHTITTEDLDSLRELMGSPFRTTGLQDIIDFDFSGVRMFATKSSFSSANKLKEALKLERVYEMPGESCTAWISKTDPEAIRKHLLPCSRPHLMYLSDQGTSGILLRAEDTPGLDRLVFALTSVLKTFRDERRQLFVGDLQFHSRSGGDDTSPSCAYFTSLATMLNFMDFAGMSDHDTVISTRLVQSMLRDRTIDYNLMLNQEVTNGVTHFVAVNVNDRIDYRNAPGKIISDIHASGGVVIAGHHGFAHKDWLNRNAGGSGSRDNPELRWVDIPVNDWRRLGVDAFEIGRGSLVAYFEPRALPITAYYMLSHYYEWAEKGDMPPVVADNDIHYPSFIIPLRTLVFATENRPDPIAASIRDGHCLAFLYNTVFGPDDLVAAFYAAVSDESYLQENFRERLISRALSLRW